MNPDQYIAAAPEPKRSELAELDALIRRTVPTFQPFMAGSMIGYGRYHYRYESGREGVSCRVGLAGTKNGISIYVTCADDNGWIAEQWKDRLGKADVGKSCIRFRRLADIDLGALTNVLRIARKLGAPGEVDGAPAGSTKTATKTTATKNKTPATKNAATKPTAKKKATARAKM